MTAPLLTLQGVSKSFGGLAAITDLSLSVERGAMVAVVGTGGAGKSTLIDLISGACRPDGGRIQLDGRDIAGLRPDRVASLGIARTFDPPRPFPSLSVIDTVAVAALLRAPDPSEARRRALDLLELLEMKPLAKEPAASLDAARAKRLELARAMATRPRLLLLDQVLTELPAPELAWLQDVLRTLNHRPGVALLLAEPRLGTVRGLADRVVVLDHGHIVTEVPADDLPE